MKNIFVTGFVLSYLLNVTFADVYLQNMRGSNNRMNENTAERRNNNRLFDSQNNNRGGYNVGEKTTSKASHEQNQYRMKFFQSGNEGDSELLLEWTNQHGCGDSANDPKLKLNCNVVMQYKCQDDHVNASPKDSFTLRNGVSTSSQSYSKPRKNEDEKRALSRRKSSISSSRGLHESWEWYDACYHRQRNKGLFTADQNLKKNNLKVDAATATRQNPNNNRSGYECPEERDYYPYWHPTPWTDLAVLAHEPNMCSYYKENSFNRKPYGECVEEFTKGRRKHYSLANNPEDCKEVGGTWTEYHSMLELAEQFKTQSECESANNEVAADRGIVYKWGKPYDEKKIVEHKPIEDVCFVQPPEVDCKVSPESRVNHLGNGIGGKTLDYKWILPHFPSLKQKRCVLRLRYNISTDDFAPFDTDSKQNGNESPVKNNPQVGIGSGNKFKLALALNTAQYGRTFQDRSHLFLIAPRPQEIDDELKIINLNVRGKRGNIVQTFPATEYDFVPNDITINEEDLVHMQWTGSNTHNNRKAGDAGEGKGGTDRHNIMQLEQPSENIPISMDSATMYNNMNVVWNSKGSENLSAKDIGIQLASSGYYKCDKSSTCGRESVESKRKLNTKLDQASPSYEGLVTSFNKGTYHYMCTRNNNFTNRSQKGTINVN